MSQIKSNKRWEWWQNRRLKYNKGLFTAGVIAFLVYCVVGEILIAPHEEFEVTLFTTGVQGIGYLFMILIANIYYTLGYLVDKWFNVDNNDTFRIKLFKLGYWFSFALPFTIPILVAFLFLSKYH